MAGEWIKFEANTPEKPEVLAITAALGWDDPDLTVGKLLRVWRWFDQQTIDGNARNVTLALLDRISGVSGFAQAMCDVGWLVLLDGGVSLPHFDRHNGKTAKDRALTAKRVANHKANAEGNAKGNAPIVTNALPREEKKREEKREEVTSKTNAPATPLPDWVPADAWTAYVAMRKTIKKPITADGIPLAIKKLQSLRDAGHDPRAVLEQSTLNSYQGLFEVKAAQQARASPAGPSQLGRAGQATAANAQRLMEKWRQENEQTG